MCTSKCWFAKYKSAQCHIDKAKCISGLPPEDSFCMKQTVVVTF